MESYDPNGSVPAAAVDSSGLSSAAATAGAPNVVAPAAAAAPGSGTAPPPQLSGWTAWELKPYMNENRNWQAVCDYWAALVRGDARLSNLGLAEPCEFRLPPEAALASAASAGGQGGGGVLGVDSDSGPVGTNEVEGAAGEAGDEGAEESAAQRRRRQSRQDYGPQRVTYKVDIAFLGSEFAGWAFQAGRRTVQGTLEAALPALLTGPQYSQSREAAAAPAGDGADGSGGGARGRGRRGSAKTGPAAKVVVSSAGRTDAGVSAYGMPISFYAWHDLPHADIAATIAAAAPATGGGGGCGGGSLRAMSVRSVPRQFHATFSAAWRRYVYLFPLRQAGPADGANGGSGSGAGSGSSAASARGSANAVEQQAPLQARLQQAQPPRPTPPRPVPPEVWRADPDVELLGALLAELRGRPLDYLACARDTPPGKDGICTLHVCRASVVELPLRRAGLGHEACHGDATSAARQGDILVGGAEARAAGAACVQGVPQVAAAADGRNGCIDGNGVGQGTGGGTDTRTVCADGGSQCRRESEAGAGGPGDVVRALAVELVGSRFLKRMVRVLVSTALREATPGAARYGGRRDALLACFAEGRDATGMPAPAAGLCFAGAGYPAEVLGEDD